MSIDFKTDSNQFVLVTTVAQSAAMPAATAAQSAARPVEDRNLQTHELQYIKSVAMPAMENFIQARMAGEGMMRAIKGIALLDEKGAPRSANPSEAEKLVVQSFDEMKATAEKLTAAILKGKKYTDRVITLCNSVFRKEPPKKIEMVCIVTEIKIWVGITSLHYDAVIKVGMRRLEREFLNFSLNVSSL